MLNTVILMGRLTKDLEIKTLPSGHRVLNFDIAVSRSKSSKDGEKITDFIDCAAWSETAEFIQKHFKKGEMLAMVGRLSCKQYEDKTGTKRKIMEVSVREVSFCGSGRGNAVPASRNSKTPDIQKESDIIEDDNLPF